VYDLLTTISRLLIIPLSFLRKLDSLKYTSVIALVSIGYLVVLVVYHYSTGDTIPARGEIHLIKWQGAVATLSSFPVIVFAYTCHQNVSRGVPMKDGRVADSSSDVLNPE
jgi:amino acid permease